MAVVHPRRRLGAVPLPDGRHAREVRREARRLVRDATARSSTGCAPSSPTGDRCGPAQIEHDAKKGARGPWWDWDVVKHALEYLWLFGEVAIAGSPRFRAALRAGRAGASRPRRSPRRSPRDDAIRELIARARPRRTASARRPISPTTGASRTGRAVMAAIGDLQDAGELAARHGRGLDSRPAGRPRRGCTAMPRSPAASTPPRSSPRSIRSCGSATAPSGSSTSSTASRSTRRRRSGASGTTRCPCSSATTSSAASTSRPIARPRRCSCSRPGGSTGGRRMPRPALADELRAAARWQGLDVDLGVAVGRCHRRPRGRAARGRAATRRAPPSRSRSPPTNRSLPTSGRETRRRGGVRIRGCR